MRSTFMGLETSKRGLFTQQSALYTTGHNISNANTEGYTRQRVNMEATAGYPGVGLNQPKTAGFIGTGVQAHSVQRMRDGFTDKQYRQETTKLGYWESRSNDITQIEDILNEPSEYGLSKAMDNFWGSLQDLSVNPENGAARSVVVQRAIAVADSFEYMHTSIKQLQENTSQEIRVSLKDVNSILQQIASLNDQIQVVEPNGYMPNDLYDARDVLLDKLSKHFPIETKKIPSGGNALEIAEGSMVVSAKLKDGTLLKLVDGKEFAQLQMSGPNVDDAPTSMVLGVHLVKGDGSGTYLNKDWSTVGTQEIQYINNFTDTGKFKSLINSFGYSSDGTSTGTEYGLFSDMITKLNALAQSFAEEFNKIHMGSTTDSNYPQGSDINGNAGGAFFVNGTDGTVNSITASNLYVSSAIINDPGKIVASNSAPGMAEPGNGKFALKLANMKFTGLSALNGVSAQTYFEGLIGKLGVDGQQAERLRYNTETLQQAVVERRASESSVSLDEEMTNMVTFQHAYNASARMITVVDETLDKIINGMGRAGI